MNLKASRISVITVTLNASSGLQKTLESIAGQDYPDLEIIVIDGGSADGTLDVIQAHAEQIAYWISEPDGGIYDAMNKGLAHATGIWVIFMNTGDIFVKQNLLSMVFIDGPNDADVIFGDSVVVYPGFKAYRPAGFPENLWKGMICNHQSMFFRTEILQKNGYDTSFRIGADHELILRLFIQNKRFVRFQGSVAAWTAGGISDRERVASVTERYRIVRMHLKLSFSMQLHYVILCLNTAILQAGCALMSKRVIMSIVRWSNRKYILQENQC